jgi:hypothetical protein
VSPDRITAGELRAMGLAVPDSIPDCGNVARSSMVIRQTGSELKGDVLNVGMSVTFTEPFQWVTVPITITDVGGAA